MSEALAPWIVVNTHPHKEASAIANLQNQGFNTYCPMLRKRVRHARRTTNVLRPLFPGYLFIELADQSLSWRPILSTIGVRTVVRNGEEPCRLDAMFIAALRAREQDGVIVAPPVPYAAGQKVRITDGPFDGTVATIIDLAEKDRLVVLLEILNRPVNVKISARQVSPA
ncbi:MAG: transcription termination/antitermination protein NusG [Deltaproteobacteria bacterium]